MHVSPIDLLLIALYGVFVLGIGFAVRRRISGSGDFLLAGLQLDFWPDVIVQATWNHSAMSQYLPIRFQTSAAGRSTVISSGIVT